MANKPNNTYKDTGSKTKKKKPLASEVSQEILQKIIAEVGKEAKTKEENFPPEKALAVWKYLLTFREMHGGKFLPPQLQSVAHELVEKKIGVSRDDRTSHIWKYFGKFLRKHGMKKIPPPLISVADQIIDMNNDEENPASVKELHTTSNITSPEGTQMVSDPPHSKNGYINPPIYTLANSGQAEIYTTSNPIFPVSTITDSVPPHFEYNNRNPLNSAPANSGPLTNNPIFANPTVINVVPPQFAYNYNINPTPINSGPVTNNHIFANAAVINIVRPYFVYYNMIPLNSASVNSGPVTSNLSFVDANLINLGPPPLGYYNLNPTPVNSGLVMSNSIFPVATVYTIPLNSTPIYTDPNLSQINLAATDNQYNFPSNINTHDNTAFERKLHQTNYSTKMSQYNMEAKPAPKPATVTSNEIMLNEDTPSISSPKNKKSHDEKIVTKMSEKEKFAMRARRPFSSSMRISNNDEPEQKRMKKSTPTSGDEINE